MKINLLKILSHWLPVIIWASVIFTLSSKSSLKVSDFFLFDFVYKKIAHVFVYGLLFMLIFRATDKNWILSFVLTMLYAVSDEYHQSQVPGRNASAIDLGIDLSGANIAAYTLWKLKQSRLAKHKK